MIIPIILGLVVVLIWIWLGSKIFWKEGFKELDRVLGKSKVDLNYKKESKDGNKETK